MLELVAGSDANARSKRDTTTITYGTGKITGGYFSDQLCFGDDAACYKDISFLGVFDETTFPFVELPFDGICGLGLTDLST